MILANLIIQEVWPMVYGKSHDFGESGDFCSKCDIHKKNWHKQVSEGIRIRNYINECLNMFVSKFWHKQMSEYVCVWTFVLLF